MDSMRRLHFGTNKHAEFTAHVHILDLLNVPLVEGECRIKWRFKGGITLNSTNNDKVMGQALQTSKPYLKDLRSSAGAAVGSMSSTNAGPSSPRDSEERGGGSTSMTDAYGHHYNHHHHSHDDSNEQHHSLGERVKDALFHPHRTLKASTSSHNNALSAHSTVVSSSNQSSGSSPRSRSHTLPHTSTSSSPSSPTVVAASSPSASSPHYISSPGGHTLRRDITPTDYFKLQGGGPGSATIGDKAEEASGNNAGTSNSSRRRPSASASASASEAGKRSFSPPPFPPSSPHSPRSQYYNNPLSPAVTLRAQDGPNAGNAPRTPPASSTAAAAARGYPSSMTGGGESNNGQHRTTPPSRSATRQMQSQSQSQSNGDRDRDRDYLQHTSSVQSRRHGSLGPSGASSDSPLSSSLSKTHATLYESLKCAGMPSKAEAKGKTSYTPLMNCTVRFDQHIICAVAIPMRKNTKQLEESVVKLKVSYKIRTTPIPERIGSRPASIASGNLNGIATTADEDGKGADAKSIASSIRSHKTRVNGANVSLLSPATSGSSTPMINAKEAHEEVHLGDLWLNLSEFVSAEMAEGFFAGQGKPRVKEAWITRRYLLQNGRTNALLRVAVKMDWLSGIRDFTAPPLTKGQIISPKKNFSRQLHGNGKDKEQDRESVYSAASGSSSRMYLQGDNISSRSFVSAEYSTSGGQRPSSSYRAVSRTRRYGDSPESSDDGQGERRHHHHHHNRHDYRHQYESSDEVQAEVDLINEIFETEDTPPSTPPLTPEKSASWADESGFGSPFETITHSTADSLVPHEQQHHSRLHAFGSPAQKLAFLHRNKDKANKGKNSQKQATLGVVDLDGRKRTHSAPSRAFSSPAGSVSRPSTPASGQADWFVHDDHNGGRPGRTSHEVIRPSRETQHSHNSHGSGHHHHHHHEQPRPVLVHVPTAQEPIDIHAHPFRWVGKATPAMRAARQSTSSSTNSSTHSLPLAHFEGGLGGGGGASAGHPMAGAGRQDRAKTIGVAEMSKPKHASGLSHSTVLSSSDEDLSRTAKRATSMSAVAAQVFKMPFKNRSSSNLSTTSSARNSIIEHTMPVSVSESNIADAKRDSAEVPSRGSLDLQRTLRPGQLDPAVPKSNLKRTASPAPMTVAEEQDLQEYIEKSARSSLDKETKYSGTDSPIHGDSGRSSPTKATKEVRWEEEDSSSKSIKEIMRRVDEQHQKRIRERKEREEDGSSSLPGSSRCSSRASSLNNASRSSSTERRRNLIRQPSNDEVVNERARVLREKGLLPTLSITTSEDADAVSPVTEHGPPGQEGNAMDAMLARGEVTSRSHVTEDQQDHK